MQRHHRCRQHLSGADQAVGAIGVGDPQGLEAQFGGGLAPVDGDGGARQGGRSEGAEVHPPPHVGEAIPVALHHLEVGEEVVRQGGAVVLAETPEIYGAEHLLTRRADDMAFFNKFIEKGVIDKLKGVIDKEQPQLVILGKQSIDGDNNQTGQMFAALTGLAQGTFAAA